MINDVLNAVPIRNCPVRKKKSEDDLILITSAMSPRVMSEPAEVIQEEASWVKDDTRDKYKQKVYWSRVIFYALIHLLAAYGLLLVTWRCMWQTLLFAFIIGWVSNLSITAGYHRLWSHRAYTARLPLRIFLGLTGALAVQESIYDWCRSHRSHHKFTDTNADPHNAKRGFFFSHVGWLLMEEHPEVVTKKEQLDTTDLLNDPVVYYQHKYYGPLVLLICIALPTLVPVYFWGESLWYSFLIGSMLRLVLTYNITFSVNSVAHIWGSHPYDERIDPAQNYLVSFFALGEGWHNYHHVFPFDYRTSEFPWKLNPTTLFIDIMNCFGLAYGLKAVSPAAIKARAQKTGDGTLHERKDHEK